MDRRKKAGILAGVLAGAQAVLLAAMAFARPKKDLPRSGKDNDKKS